MSPLDPLSSPRRLLDGAEASSEEASVARLLAELEDAPGPSAAARERVWCTVRAARQPSVRLRRLAQGGAGLLACGAAAAAALLLARPEAPTPIAPAEAEAVLTLVSGEVALTPPAGQAAPAVAGARVRSGTRLAAGERSRAFVRLAKAGVLLEQRSAASLGAGRAAVVVEQGSALFAVEEHPPESPFRVRAGGTEVQVVGTVFLVRAEAGRAGEVGVVEGRVLVREAGREVSVGAGECWRPHAGVQPCAAGAEADLVRALAAASGPESLLRVEGDEQLALRAGGLELGRPPLQWLAPVGALRVLGQIGESRVEGEVAVSEGSESRLVLRLPADARPPAARPESVPRAAAPKRRPMPPQAPAAAGPRVDEPAPAVDSEAEAYRQAHALAHEGRFLEAAEAFEAIGGGAGRYAEVALYEAARLRKVRLADAAGALRLLERHRARYPRGVVRPEVDLTVVEACLVLHDRERAGREIDAFLAAHPASEQRPQVLLLRAELLRERADFAAALLAYREVEASGEVALRDEASYAAAVCLARLGRAGEARAQLERYLEQFPAGRHRKAAESALRAGAD